MNIGVNAHANLEARTPCRAWNIKQISQLPARHFTVCSFLHRQGGQNSAQYFPLLNLAVMGCGKEQSRTVISRP